MKNRLFIALNIPYSVRELLIKTTSDYFGKDSPFRWEPIEKLHITLKFLGGTEKENNSVIMDALSNCTAGFPKINLKIDKFGTYKRKDKHAILWAGLSKNQKLQELVHSIEHEFEAIGFKKENRKFSAHVTLSRLRGREESSKIDDFVRLKPSIQHFESSVVTLFESKLLPGKSVYYNIKEYNLV